MVGVQLWIAIGRNCGQSKEWFDSPLPRNERGIVRHMYWSEVYYLMIDRLTKYKGAIEFVKVGNAGFRIVYKFEKVYCPPYQMNMR